MSDNSILNLSESNIINIQFINDLCFEGQAVERIIIIGPKKNPAMNDILIK